MSAFHKYIIVIRSGTIVIEAQCGCTVTMATVILRVERQKNSSEIRISRIFRFHESKYADTDNKLADTVKMLVLQKMAHESYFVKIILNLHNKCSHAEIVLNFVNCSFPEQRTRTN